MASKEDESKSDAALKAAKERMANHRLVVVDSKHGDQSIVCMNSETMQGLAVTPLDENGNPDEDNMEEFFDDDYVEIVGHLKLRGVALLMTDESLGDGEIAISKMLRENLKVKLGTKEFPDYVMVYVVFERENFNHLSLSLSLFLIYSYLSLKFNTQITRKSTPRIRNRL